MKWVIYLEKKYRKQQSKNKTIWFKTNNSIIYKKIEVLIIIINKFGTNKKKAFTNQMMNN